MESYLNFTVNYHASILINNNIYIDPLNIEEEKHNATAILITHPHWDHCSIEDIKKVMNESTYIYAPSECLDKLLLEGAYNNGKMYAISSNQEYVIPNTNVKVTTFPSYNINKPFHPKEKDWVGFIVEVENIKYAICGDTDFTSELSKINCDVLFIPIGGKYTMDAIDAAKCTNKIRPKIVVPIHYLLKSKDGSILGDQNLFNLFSLKIIPQIEIKKFF